MSTQRVTMKDVAVAAGVSVKTVSNVVNGKAGQASAETRERVNLALEKLGYSMNHSAQALKKGRTGVIGLAVPNFGQPFFSYFVDTLTQIACQRGYAIMVSTFGEMQGCIDEFASYARRLNADGWIMFADRPIAVDSPVFQQDYPVVLVGDYLSHGLCDVVTMPNVEAARYLTDWLFLHGAKHVGFIGAPIGGQFSIENFESDGNIENTSIATSSGSAILSLENVDKAVYERRIMSAVEGNAPQRLQGYMQALYNRGCELDWRIIIPCHVLTVGEGASAVFELAQRGPMPDALLCVDDAVALGAISALTKLHIDVPHDVQVTGIDYLPDGEFSIPPLTTIDPRVDQYAEFAVDALLKRIEGIDDDNNVGPSVFTSGFRLIERGSTLSTV